MAEAPLIVRRHFDTRAERVFDAWLDPAITRRFLFATETGTMIEADVDARVGGRFLFVDDRPDMGPVRHEGEYLEIDRPRRLVFTFAVPQYDPTYTTVAIDVVPSPGGGCDLTLSHDGVPPEWREPSSRGWGMILDSLEGVLGAQNLPDRPGEGRGPDGGRERRHERSGFPSDF